MGSVRLDLSTTGTTSSTAAATALTLEVSVNPAKLNVAEVEGRLTLATSQCETPAAAEEEPSEAAAPRPLRRRNPPSNPRAPAPHRPTSPKRAGMRPRRTWRRGRWRCWRLVGSGALVAAGAPELT